MTRELLTFVLLASAAASQSMHGAFGHITMKRIHAPCGIVDSAEAVNPPADHASITMGPSSIRVQLVSPLPQLAYFCVISNEIAEAVAIPTCLKLQLDLAVIVPMKAPQTAQEVAGAVPMQGKEGEAHKALMTPMALHELAYTAIPAAYRCYIQVFGVLTFPDGSIYIRGSEVVEVERE